jgi:DNA (cytosine-5)-methyltransferase 1
MKPIALDLFCGAGGFTIGLKNSGYDVKTSIDFFKPAIDTQKLNGNKNHIALEKDLTTFSPEECEKETGVKNYDIIVGGPSCQGYSMAGRRDPKDPRNSLFMEFIKYIKYYKPKVFIIENVPGILTMKNAKNELILDILLNECNDAGYNTSYKKLYCPDYGIPQKRRRVIFIGIRNEIKQDFIFPETTHTKENYIPVSTILLKKDQVDKKHFHSSKMIEGFYRRLAINKEKKMGFGAQFLKLDQPSYTISARYYKDGSDALVRYSENEVRMLTHLEVARIQTFPDTYKFAGTSREIYMQIGNAVPSRLIEIISKSIKEQIFNKK